MTLPAPSKHQAAEIIARAMARHMCAGKAGEWEPYKAFMPSAIVAVDELQNAGISFEDTVEMDEQQAREFEAEIANASPIVARVNKQLQAIWGTPDGGYVPESVNDARRKMGLPLLHGNPKPPHQSGGGSKPIYVLHHPESHRMAFIHKDQCKGKSWFKKCIDRLVTSGGFSGGEIADTSILPANYYLMKNKNKLK